MLVNGMKLPGGMVFKLHPSQEQKRQPKRQPNSDWGMVAKALFSTPHKWALIATDQATGQLARNIRSGRIRAFDPEMITADAVRVQTGPALYDIYARVRATPLPDTVTLDEHMERVAKGRAEWYEGHQLEWLTKSSKQEHDEVGEAQ